MKYYNINSPGTYFSLEHALFSNLGTGGGLYMPQSIPLLEDSFFKTLPNLSIKEIANSVLTPYFGEIVSIIDSVFTFDTPVVSIKHDTHILELFHGPTLSFKDFGTRFISALIKKVRKDSGELTVLCATSGDTGSAVAHAFYKQAGIKVVVLYPSGKISKIQEQQFTTLGENVTAVEVVGTFDDCQKLVKQAFADKERSFISANSINLARLLPQIVYYFRAVAQLIPLKAPLLVTVPSGNFGNLTAALIAEKMGLPIQHFIAAVNSNRTVPDFFESGNYSARPSIETISNAMDVGDPNNFPRVRELFSNSLAAMKERITSISVSDQETRETISAVQKKFDYILDPHGAVAFNATEKYRQLTKSNSQALLLHTAHPAKFAEVVRPLVKEGSLLTPERLEKYLAMKKVSLKIKSNYEELISILKN